MIPNRGKLARRQLFPRIDETFMKSALVISIHFAL